MGSAKPPAERSEAIIVPSEERLTKYISTYTCNKTPTILMGFKNLCQVGKLNLFFQSYPMYVAPTMSIRGPAPQAFRRARSASW